MLCCLKEILLTQSPLVYLAIGLAVVWYLRMTRSQGVAGNIPPVPVRPYPVLGHLPYLGSDPSAIFQKWRQMKGDIFSIYLGSKLVIVMNSYELLREAFVKQADKFSDRSENFIIDQHFKLFGTLGIIGNSGPSWKENRNITISILKDFGMGKNWLAEKISEEVEIYLETLAKLKGQPSEVRLVTNAAVSNIICAILIGQRFETDDPYFSHLLKLLQENANLLGGTSILYVFPWLYHIPGDPFKARKLFNNSAKIYELFGGKFMKEAKENEGGQGVDNFISSYIKHMKERQNSGDSTHLNETTLINVLGDLFAAGSETTSTTILWAMLFAITHPEAQDKFYQEILDVIGPERRPSILDKPKMNYINAFIMETQRLGSIVPLSLSHGCNETVEVGGYTIPKDTMIIPNLDQVLQDTKTWDNATSFQPERFLDEDGKVAVPEEFIPFSIGRRLCLGESLAKMELFLFLTGLFQRFHIRPEDPNHLPSTERVFGITSTPKPFHVRLLNRHEDN